MMRHCQTLHLQKMLGTLLHDRSSRGHQVLSLEVKHCTCIFSVNLSWEIIKLPMAFFLLMSQHRAHEAVPSHSHPVSALSLGPGDVPTEWDVCSVSLKKKADLK